MKAVGLDVLNSETLVILFFILLLIPFFFPVYELIRKKEKRLDIYLLYSRDPGFWGSYYIKLLDCTISNNMRNVNSMRDLKKLQNDVFLEIELCYENRKEKIFITKSFDKNDSYLKRTSRIDFVVLNTQDLELNREFIFEKELIVLGDLTINTKCFFNNLLVLGNIFFNSSAEVLNHLYAEGEIHIDSILTVSGSIFSSKKIFINSKLSSKRIFSPEIIFIDDIDQKYQQIDENKKVELSGNIKVNGNFIIDSKEKYIIIDGNIVCDNDLYLKGNIWVKNNVFSQGNISICDGILIGKKGKIKSVVARKSINITGINKFYGYIHSEKGILINP